MSYKELDTNKRYLVTGAAGFIGFYQSLKLLESGCKVIGIDNINDYYDVRLKEARLEKLESYENFTFIKGDISDKDMIRKKGTRARHQLVNLLCVEISMIAALEIHRNVTFY